MNYQKQCQATLRGVISYVCQKKKTGIDRENLDKKHWEKGLLTQENNTIKLLSGINCVPETAFSEFMATKSSYKKLDGIQFYHYTQSFKDGENVSPKTAHEIAIKFAETHYKDYEVLIATHIDNEHLHSHFIINSVSFETGKKLHQPPNTLRKLRLTSDNICKEYGFTTLETYTFGRSKTMGRAEKRAMERGTSWKFEMCLTIETCMKKAKNKDDFIKKMENQGYKVDWKDKNKTIIYTNSDGYYCGSDRLYGKKHQKENLIKEFELRENSDFENPVFTGWEYERAEYLKTIPQPIDTLTQASELTLEVGQEIMYAFRRFEVAQNQDDELNEIANIAALTALSFVGVYALIELIHKHNSEEFYLEDLEEMIEEVKLESENTQEFEQEQEEYQGFDMTMY